MKAAIVILNWNGETFLNKFLPLLIKHTQLPEAEIIVADNGSTDGSLELLTRDFPHIKTIVLDQNYGFAGGYNKALQQIEADYYVLLNSDVEVTENWLEVLINYMESNRDVAACQPKIRSYYKRSSFEHAGAAGGFIDFLGYPFCRGRVFGVVEEDKGQYDDITDVFWATGACLVIRSELFHKVGGLDDEFFAHMEEIDLCWRLNARGYRVVCNPESVVYHVGGGTLDSEHPYKTYLNFRNNLLMIYKNMPQKLLNEIMFWRKVLDYVAALQFFFTGKTENARSILKARKDFEQMQPRFEEKRKENILYATRSECPGMYDRSILKEFYYNRNKTFDKLMKSKKRKKRE
ncbi:MAG: glycosyl transferase family 2 [Bacteroidetes bacterium]|nr:glycosyl transferase family 2 [Bacteroidota bacterium]